MSCRYSRLLRNHGRESPHATGEEESRRRPFCSLIFGVPCVDAFLFGSRALLVAQETSTLGKACIKNLDGFRYISY